MVLITLTVLEHSGQHHSLGSETLDCISTGTSTELADMCAFICLHSSLWMDVTSYFKFLSGCPCNMELKVKNPALP